jgi:hypothetical protein
VSGIATAPIVAAGAGNIVATGGGNVIQAGPAAIVATGGGNVIGGNSSSIVAQGAGNRRLLADEDLLELPVAGAMAFARDPSTLALVPGLLPVRTDEHGAFRFSGVPAGTTVLVEVVFVGKDRKAARLLAMAKGEPAGAKPVTVSTASTLAAAQLCKAAEAGGDQGQISLMERPAIDGMVEAIQAVLATDAANMRKATSALAMAVPEAGDVQVKAQETDAFYQAATDQALALVKLDPALKAKADEANQALTQPLTDAQKQAVNVLKPVAVPSVATNLTTALASTLGSVVATPTPAPTTTTTAYVAPSAAASTSTSTTTSANATSSPATSTATPTPTAATPTPAPTATPPISVTVSTATATPLLTVSIAPIITLPTPSPIIKLPLL